MQNSGSRGSPGLGMSTRAADGVIVAELAGELGVASAPVLREQFLGLLRPGLQPGGRRPVQGELV